MGFLSRVHELLPAGVIRVGFDVLLIIGGAWLLFVILSRVVKAIGRRAEARVAREAGRQVVSSVFRVIGGLANAGVIFFAGIAILDRLGITWVVAGPMLGGVVGTIMVAWVAFQVVAAAVGAAVGRAKESIEHEVHRQRVTTLLLLVRNFAKYVIIFGAGVMVLDQLGLDIGVVLAGAGIVGLAVGFGAQNLVRDIVSGFFMIMEGQYAVGDLVEVNGVFGQVEGLGLRVTRLRDPNGQLRYVPNGTISRASNYTAKCVAHTITIPLPAQEPADPAALVRLILADFEREFQVFAGPPEIGAVEVLDTYGRVIRVETRAIPGRHTVVEQKLAVRMGAALERAGHPLPAGTEITVSLRYPPLGVQAT